MTPKKLTEVFLNDASAHLSREDAAINPVIHAKNT
jgi:hypothetical protein